MIGRRVELVPQPGGFQLLAPGEYGKWNDGTWHARTPNGHGANLSAHTVVEHEDGTITVSPSILITTSRDGWKTTVELWHGFLECGVWRSC